MRFERLDLNLLVALDPLIEDRSVSLAARRLYLSQPAVTGALNRLRDFFGDDLLVPSGRQMILTPKAEELRGPVREALILIRTKITTPVAFDPASAERQFTIVVSDYAYHVLIAGVIQEAASLAPGVTFDLAPVDRRGAERLEHGDVDLLLTISTHMLEGHPRKPMFMDDHAVISWSGGSYQEITAEAFLAAHHAVAYFGPDRHPAFTEAYFSQQGVARSIDVASSDVFSPPPRDYRHGAVGDDVPPPCGIFREVPAPQGAPAACFLAHRDRRSAMAHDASLGRRIQMVARTRDRARAPTKSRSHARASSRGDR
jgi:LysR family nod box-dependent transcriptional activator